MPSKIPWKKIAIILGATVAIGLTAWGVVELTCSTGGRVAAKGTVYSSLKSTIDEVKTKVKKISTTLNALVALPELSAVVDLFLAGLTTGRLPGKRIAAPWMSFIGDVVRGPLYGGVPSMVASITGVVVWYFKR